MFGEMLLGAQPGGSRRHDLGFWGYTQLPGTAVKFSSTFFQKVAG